ncbi:MAG: ATP-binding protein [Mycobacteriales bacterium]
MDATDVIELCVAARVESIAVVRAVAADVAGRVGFGFDALLDVRMAADEVCAEVVRVADPEQMMRVAFGFGDGKLWVTVSARINRDHGRIDTSGFGWRVLGALTDELHAEYTSGPSHEEVLVRLAKKDPGR